jgi:hypothetical protein
LWKLDPAATIAYFRVIGIQQGRMKQNYIFHLIYFLDIIGYKLVFVEFKGAMSLL